MKALQSIQSKRNPKVHSKKILIRFAILWLAISFTPLWLNAQNQHEVKFNGAYASINIYHLSYEFIPKEKFTLEASLIYQLSNVYIDTSTNTPLYLYNGLEFDQHYARFLLSGRYYFIPNHGADRLFIGSYLEYKTQTYRDPEYDDLYLKKYGRMPSLDTPDFGIGIMAGYKQLFWKRLVLETWIGMSLDLDSFNQGYISSSGHFAINVGYRFPHLE